MLIFLFLGVFYFINLKAIKDKVKEKEELAERPGQLECKVLIIVIMVLTNIFTS